MGNYNDAIRASANSQSAYDYFCAARAGNIRLQPPSYNTVIWKLANDPDSKPSRARENAGRSMEVLNEMRARGIRTMTCNFNGVIKAHARIGQTQQIWNELYPIMKREGLGNEETTLLTLLEEQDTLTCAAYLIAFSQDRETLETVLKNPEFHKKYNFIFRKVIQEGNDKAVSALYQLRSNLLKLDTISQNHLIQYYAKKGDVENAVKVYLESPAKKDSETFHALFRAARNAKDSGLSYRIYQEMKIQGIPLDDVTQKICWSVVKLEGSKETEVKTHDKCKQFYKNCAKVNDVGVYRLSPGYRAMQASRQEGSNTISNNPEVAGRIWEKTDDMVREWAKAGPKSPPITLDQIRQINRSLGGTGEWRLRDVCGGGREELLYAPTEVVNDEIIKFYDWFVKSLQYCDDGSNPIETAARVAQRFVSIHPFGDQNGRTSRMLMDYVLQRYGLPPAALGNDMLFGMFSFTPNGQTPTKATESVLAGVQRSYEMLRIGKP